MEVSQNPPTLPWLGKIKTNIPKLGILTGTAYVIQNRINVNKNIVLQK